MSERAAFINAILDNPADDTLRLVFADWLQENGEPARAEFIRAQIEAAKLPAADRAKSKPGKRAAALLKSHQTAWREALGVAKKGGEYERGFLAGVPLVLDAFPERVATMLAREPVWVSLELVANVMPLSWVKEFAASLHLRAVTDIVSPGSGFGAKRFFQLMQSPHLVNLRNIVLFDDPVGATGVKAIANAPAAFALEALDLTEALYDSSTKSQVEAIKALAASPRLASLQSLSLKFNGLTDKSIQALLASKTLPRTMWLELDDNDYDEKRFAEAIAKRFQPPED